MTKLQVIAPCLHLKAQEITAILLLNHCINHCVHTIQDHKSFMLGVQHCHALQNYTNDCLNKLLIHHFKK